MNTISSASAPSTPTEQVKQIHNGSTKKKTKQGNKVHFPEDEKLVSCFLEPPDPWSRVYGNTLDTLVSSYMAACDKQGIKPLTCVLDQLQEFESFSFKLDSNPRAFDLSILGEKLSVKHCEALEEVLRRMQFTLIDLEGCYLEDEGAAAFFDMIEYYDSAAQLNISFTKHIDCRGWQACSRMLKKTTSLVHLNARSTGLCEQVLLIVGRALRLGSNLVTLHLENCNIFGRCLVILVAALKLNTTLRELFLAENKISAADGFQLGNLLRTNTHLELLDLSNNKLQDEGLTHVMDSLGQQSNTSGRGLYTLILWNNELTVKGMSCVSRALTAARALRRLNLGSNAITSAGVMELKQSFICNRTIEVLELENAGITSEGSLALAEYLSQNQFIQKLDLRGNDVRLDGLEALGEAVAKNPNVISLQIDATSLDLSEPIRERQEKLQEIAKCCQRNKEAKSSLPPQDAQLSILFNGIFSHVLPSTLLPGEEERHTSQNFFKGRFRVSVVEPPPTVNTAPEPSRSDESQPKDNLVINRVNWLESLNASSDNTRGQCSCKAVALNLLGESVPSPGDDSEVFLPGDGEEGVGLVSQTRHLSLTLVQEQSGGAEFAPKLRRSSSPTISTAPLVCRKTRSIKCGKELEGLDLRSTVPLSPTRLHESFDFQESQADDAPLGSQMNMKASHTVYMVH